jgi:glyoxylase-like metal-dependent hydrolase (beta-lactamase superfamily II)/rhodanese-related sulfurtransferase
VTASLVHPIVDQGLGNSSYLVDLGDGRALVVDPVRDPAPYLDLAHRRRLWITHAVETHLHADFVSGSRELAARGARVVAARAAGLGFPHQGLDDEDELDLGGLRLRAVAAPGHTPEQLAWLLLDGARPLALFSGGALLVGGVARTDLIDPDQTEALTRAAWRSLQRLRALPDDLPVYPTHGAGSFCSAPGAAERTTTIGAERAHNPLLAAPDEEAFAARLLGGLGSFPPYFLRLREVNRRGPRLLEERDRTLAALPVQEVRRRLDEGAVLVDVRPAGAFAAGHPAGALSIALRPAFATWLGWLVEGDRPLVFLLDRGQDRAELLRQCLAIGYDRLLGELAGGLAAWREAGLPEGHLEPVAPAEIDGPVLDVRQASEVALGHLPGAVAVELGKLGIDRGTPLGFPGPLRGEGLPAGPLTVMCEHGERATTAASLLARAGRRDLRVVIGGGAAEWSAATGRPLARP